MDAKHSFFSVAKIPIVGELIIATAIYLTLSVSFATLGYFEMEEEEKREVFNIFFYIAIAYMVCSICYRVFRIFKKTK